MNTGFAARLIGALALAFAVGGCATSEGESFCKNSRGECLSELVDILDIFSGTGFVTPEREDYAMQILLLGDMLGYYGKSNDMIRCYGMVASNGLWQAQQRLYELHLNEATPFYSLSDAAFWLDKAAKQYDGFAAERLAGLYESNAIPGGNAEIIGSLYDTAALSYVKQWKDEEFESLTCASEPPDDSDELKPEDCSVHLVVQVWNFKYRRVPFSEHPKYCVMDVVGSYWFDEHRAITDFFNKAISFGNKAAEEHFGTYRKELEYYRETGTFPEFGKNVESTGDKAKKGTP